MITAEQARSFFSEEFFFDRFVKESAEAGFDHIVLSLGYFSKEFMDKLPFIGYEISVEEYYEGVAMQYLKVRW